MSKLGNTSVKVFYRIFPTERKCWDDVKVKDKRIVLLRNIHAMSKVWGPKKLPSFYEFMTDGVFFNTSQEEIYETIMKDVLVRVTEGYNAIIGAFGQTGTGKSLTLHGLQMSAEDLGIAPRIISDLFGAKNKLPNNVKICIQMSYAEFSRTTVNDLLTRKKRSMDIWHVKKDITKIKVKTVSEALKLLFLAEGRKSFARNEDYYSHLQTSVLTFYVTTKMLHSVSHIKSVRSDEKRKKKKWSQAEKTWKKKIEELHIIDMAGVDTVGHISCNFKDPHDIGMANLMKNDMVRFFMCILEKHPEQTKLRERQNPFMYFLGKDLNKEGFLRLIGHIKIQREELPITISTLRFGEILRGVKPFKKEMEFEENEESKIVYLENQIEKLQKEKLQNSVLMNQDLSRNLNQARINHLNRTLHCYLKDQITEIGVMNVAEVSTVFKMLKEICNQAEAARSKLAVDRRSSSSDIVVRTKRPAKSSSRASTDYKPFKRFSRKKSKEQSLTVIEKVSQVDKGSSAHSMALKEPTVSKMSYINNKSVTSIATSVGHRKKSRVSSGKMTPTKKSSGSVTGSRKESQCLPVLSESLPDNQQAWVVYAEEISCKTLQDDYGVNEAKIKEAHAAYLDEVKKLHELRETIEAKHNELIEINMLKNFNLSNTADDESSYFVESDELCRETLKQAEADLLTQQEVVLTTQSELKIYLNNRKELRDQLNEDFENFCRTRYNVPMPMMDKKSIDQRSERKASQSRRSRRLSSKQPSELSLKLEDLRKTMRKEQIKTMKEREKQGITWKR